MREKECPGGRGGRGDHQDKAGEGEEPIKKPPKNLRHVLALLSHEPEAHRVRGATNPRHIGFVPHAKATGASYVTDTANIYDSTVHLSELRPW